jgi:two-component system OmpR family sensor kinase
MNPLARLPIRARITAAFAVVMIVLLFAIGLTLYLAMGAALADEIDTGLRFRADALAPLSQQAVVERQIPALEEPGEAFDQLLSPSGVVLRSTPSISSRPLLNPAEVRQIDAPRFFTRSVAGVEDEARLLAIPLTSNDVLVVGSSVADRTDALAQLLLVLSIGGPIAVALASYAGWRVAGWAMQPVERIRQEASAITASGLDRRIELPPSRDELYRLTETLNDMLRRLDEALTSERRFLQHASHELRTPLAALKAELDLARSAPRTKTELAAAIASAAEETHRLARLADDILVLARAHDGRVPVHREPVNLLDLAAASAALFTANAGLQGRVIEVEVPAREVLVDPRRVRQALDNLLDNALRHTPSGADVRVCAQISGRTLALTVSDSGAGFAVLNDGVTQEGLGLRIAAAVAASHGGGIALSNAPEGGAVVTMTFDDVLV